MKKIILLGLISLSCSYTIAQTEYDALKTVQTDINGTARYMSMAGAFGALGGDASAIKDNPAGLGIFRHSEIVGTLNLSLQDTKASWSGKNSTDNLYKVGFNNFSYILANPTGQQGDEILNSNWSFSYNHLKSFDRNLRINGIASSLSLSDYMAYMTSNAEATTNHIFSGNDINYDNQYIPFLSVMGYKGYLINEYSNGWRSDLNSSEKITPTYQSQETGGVNEYSLGWAGNFGNKFFLGATANVQTINYNTNSSYSEILNGRNGGFTLKNSFNSTGAGVNLKIGAILMPTDFLRFGLSINTPTISSLTHSYSSSIESNFFSVYEDTIVNGATDNYGSYKFQLLNPVELSLSSAVFFQNKGLLSFEYDFKDYSALKFINSSGSSTDYTNENDGMKIMLDKSHTFKVGGEYNLTDNFSLRAGYAYTTSAMTSNADKLVLYNTTRNDSEYLNHNNSKYVSAGFGYREAGWFLDFAYLRKTIDETFYPFNAKTITTEAVEGANIITTNNNLVVTLGFKF